VTPCIYTVNGIYIYIVKNTTIFLIVRLLLIEPY